METEIESTDKDKEGRQRKNCLYLKSLSGQLILVRGLLPHENFVFGGIQGIKTRGK
jgi:hypothetical protein